MNVTAAFPPCRCTRRNALLQPSPPSLPAHRELTGSVHTKDLPPSGTTSINLEHLTVKDTFPPPCACSSAEGQEEASIGQLSMHHSPCCGTHLAKVVNAGSQCGREFLLCCVCVGRDVPHTLAQVLSASRSRGPLVQGLVQGGLLNGRGVVGVAWCTGPCSCIMRHT